ncbi:hypothetical protein Q0M94_25135 (plasmid) [Deinococcus radiomollis]|uniref:hypothetical protein n=1 Tax=Deinococcus radiomollis TaxID=468916 RepID=UPI003891D4BE
MSLLDQANDTADLPALIRQLTGQPYPQLRSSGGTIPDPRPGHDERHASFSVFKNLNGVWMWKRRGAHRDVGTAYHLLLAFGFSPAEAAAILAGDNDYQGTSRPVIPRAPPSQLSLARQHAARIPSDHETLYALSNLSTIEDDSPAAQDLTRRGLRHSGVLKAYSVTRPTRTQHRTSLAFTLHRAWGGLLNVKVRNLGENLPRYSYRLSGMGTPAWVNPDYGDAPMLLIVEGELNAVAAFEAASACGRFIDVQGLAGSDTWPHLTGLNRDVRVYTDPDTSGNAAWERLYDLLHEAGATSVTRLPVLETGDYCDLLGQHGPEALNVLLDPLPDVPVGPDETLSAGTPIPGNWPLRTYHPGRLNG